MNLNKVYSYCLEFISSNNYKKQLKAIYVIVIPLTILVAIGTQNTLSTDSTSYLDVGRNMFNVGLDSFRTPLYLLVCHFSELIGGDNYYSHITIWLQQIVFLFSIAAFHYSARKLINSSKIVFFCTLLYACHPGIMLWNQCIMTESFAVSGLVFFVYAVVKFVRKPTCKTSILANIILLLLLSLRPSFLYLIPLGILFWGYLFFRKRSLANVSGFLGILSVVGLSLFYCSQFKRQYDLFTFSTVGIYNQYYILREANLIRLDEIENASASFKKDLSATLYQKGISIYDEEFLPLAQKYGYPLMNGVVKNAISKHYKEMMSIIARRVHEVNSLKIYTYYAIPESLFAKAYTGGLLFIFNLTFRIVYFFLLGYGLWLISYSVRNKRMPLLSFLLLCITSGHLITSIVGAQMEWSRLTMPCTPLLFIMAGQCIDQFYIRRKPNVSIA